MFPENDIIIVWIFIIKAMSSCDYQSWRNQWRTTTESILPVNSCLPRKPSFRWSRASSHSGFLGIRYTATLKDWIKVEQTCYLENHVKNLKCVILSGLPKTNWEPFQTSKIEFFAKKVNGWKSVNIFAKSSIAYILQGSEYSSIPCRSRL